MEFFLNHDSFKKKLHQFDNFFSGAMSITEMDNFLKEFENELLLLKQDFLLKTLSNER